MGNIMTCKINADTSDGLKIVSDTSGAVDIQSNGATKVTIDANGNVNTVGQVSTTDNGTIVTRQTAKPIIINGDMQVAQRGTSVTGIGSSRFTTCDRMGILVNNMGNWTVIQSDDAPTGSGFQHSWRMDCTTADASPAASDFCGMRTMFEGQDLQMFKKGTSSAEKMTIAFYVKSNKTGTYIMEIDDNDNGRNINQAYTINSADTWEKKVLSFDGDTTGAFGNDNGRSLVLIWWNGAGSDFTSGTLQTAWAATDNTKRVVGCVNLADSTDNDWSITGIQLEVGEFDSTTIPSFQHESFGDNLRRCQRYCQRWNGDSAYNVGMTGVYNDTTTIVCIHTHIVPMRTAATFSISAASDFDLEPFDVAPSQVSTFGTGNEYQQAIDATDTSTRTKGFAGVITVDQTDGFFDFDAEL